MGLTSYVIETARPFMTATLLPVVSFASLALIAFATGSLWGICAIAQKLPFLS